MTPSDLAKVREALESIRCARCSGGGKHPNIVGEDLVDCLLCDGDGIGTHSARAALAILDREAGRKTRTVYVLEAMLGGQWVCIERTPDRERVEKYRVSFGAAIRILEVTESWEEPKP